MQLRKVLKFLCAHFRPLANPEYSRLARGPEKKVNRRTHWRQTCGENFAYPGMFAKFAVTGTVISLL